MALIDDVIEAIADAKNKEPENLDLTLENHICTDSIERLDEHESNSWKLLFDLPNHTVQITGDGTVMVNGAQEKLPR
jgi:hypothetical protein